MMKTKIALSITIGGALLLVAPLILTFLLAMLNQAVVVHNDDRLMCYLGGWVMLGFGLFFAMSAFRAVDNAPAKSQDLSEAV